MCQRIFEMFDPDLRHEFRNVDGIMLCYVPRGAVKDVKSYTGPFERYQDGVEHNKPVYLIDKSRTLGSYFQEKTRSELQKHVNESMFLVLHVTQQLQSNPQGILHRRFTEKQIGYDDVNPGDSSLDSHELVVARMDAVEASLRHLASGLEGSRVASDAVAAAASRAGTVTLQHSVRAGAGIKLQPLRSEESGSRRPRLGRLHRHRGRSIHSGLSKTVATMQHQQYVTAIQARWRSKLAHKAAWQRQRSIVYLQARCRGKRLRCQRRQWTMALILIQALWRGKMARARRRIRALQLGAQNAERRRSVAVENGRFHL